MSSEGTIERRRVLMTDPPPPTIPTPAPPPDLARMLAEMRAAGAGFHQIKKYFARGGVTLDYVQGKGKRECARRLRQLAAIRSKGDWCETTGCEHKAAQPSPLCAKCLQAKWAE